MLGVHHDPNEGVDGSQKALPAYVALTPLLLNTLSVFSSVMPHRATRPLASVTPVQTFVVPA